MNGSASSGISGLLQSQTFWEVAFVLALVLIIGAHKITVEGMIGGSV
jgi:hypothetical protein